MTNRIPQRFIDLVKAIPAEEWKRRVRDKKCPNVGVSMPQPSNREYRLEEGHCGFDSHTTSYVARGGQVVLRREPMHQAYDACCSDCMPGCDHSVKLYVAKISGREYAGNLARTLFDGVEEKVMAAELAQA